MATKAAKKKAAKKKAAKKKTTTKKAKKKAPAASSSAAARPVWTLQGKGQSCGLHADAEEVWAGWPSGDVVACDHDGHIQRRWRLPDGVNALVADQEWRYAGCDDGYVYDLTGSRPRRLYEVNKATRVLWIDVFRGRLIAGDGKGALSAFDVEGEPLFRYAPARSGDAWFARADGSGCYVGNDDGVSKVSWQGALVWHTPTENIGFGQLHGDDVVVYEGDWESANVLRLDKQTGKVLARGSCFSQEKHYARRHNAASCAAEDGALWGSTCNTLFAFDNDGNKTLEVALDIGTPCSMALLDGKLFVATHEGVLARFDVADLRAHAHTSKGRTSTARAVRLPAMRVSEREVDDVDEAGAAQAGVVVEVVKAKGKLKVKVVSAGHRSDWFCQFPRDLREEGARFLVDGVREADGFYRVFGEIRRVRG